MRITKQLIALIMVLVLTLSSFSVLCAFADTSVKNADD